jgi:hypothetical protein
MLVRPAAISASRKPAAKCETRHSRAVAATVASASGSPAVNPGSLQPEARAFHRQKAAVREHRAAVCRGIRTPAPSARRPGRTCMAGNRQAQRRTTRRAARPDPPRPVRRRTREEPDEPRRVTCTARRPTVPGMLPIRRRGNVDRVRLSIGRRAIRPDRAIFFLQTEADRGVP